MQESLRFPEIPNCNDTFCLVFFWNLPQPFHDCNTEYIRVFPVRWYWQLDPELSFISGGMQPAHGIFGKLRECLCLFLQSGSVWITAPWVAYALLHTPEVVFANMWNRRMDKLYSAGIMSAYIGPTVTSGLTSKRLRIGWPLLDVICGVHSITEGEWPDLCRKQGAFSM